MVELSRKKKAGGVGGGGGKETSVIKGVDRRNTQYNV